MNYEVVIIGGGLSGMMAAAFLSKKGKKVLVLEQHTTVGGLAAGFNRKGYYFDSAMHCFMAESTSGFYETLGLWEKLDFRPHRSTIIIENNTLNATDAHTLTRELCRVFSDQSDGIMRFYNEKVEKFAEFIHASTKMGNPLYYNGVKAIKKFFEMFAMISKIGFGTLSEISKSNGQLANDILARYMGRDSKAYAYFCNKTNDITYKGDFEMPNYAGNWVWPFLNMYPYSGFQGMSDKFASVIADNGGEILTGAKVTKININNGLADSVTFIEGGTEKYAKAKKIISAIDLKKTYLNLIDKEFIDENFSSKLRNQEMSSAVPLLYMGINVSGEKIREYFRGNEEVYYIPEIKIAGNDINDINYYKNTSVRISSSCLINPSHAPEGKANLQVYLPCPPVGWMNNWGIENGKRTDQYQKIKKVIIDQVLEVIENIIPDIEDRSLIEVCELGTPFTTERYTGNSEGSHGGFTWDRSKCEITGDKLGKFFTSYKGIKGLYTIGHQTGYLGGVTNALWSAKNIIKKI